MVKLFQKYTYCVIDSISKVLDELEVQSTREKSRKIDVPHEDRMLAITKERQL